MYDTKFFNLSELDIQIKELQIKRNKETQSLIKNAPFSVGDIFKLTVTLGDEVVKGFKIVDVKVTGGYDFKNNDIFTDYCIMYIIRPFNDDKEIAVLEPTLLNCITDKVKKVSIYESI